MTGFRTGCLKAALTWACVVLSYAAPGRAEDVKEGPRVDADGTVHVPAFALPESSFLSAESRAELSRQRVPSLDAFTTAIAACPLVQRAQPKELAAIRQCQARAFQETAFYRSLRARYPVTVMPKLMGGVATEVFLPREGVAVGNQKRVLINLHGGSFSGGSRSNSQVESIPIAAVARIRVISIDYRLAPEHSYPAAMEDVAIVYQEVLKHYSPRNVGIYGCSAGGALAAQAIAWFSKHKLPLPGAVGLFCYGAGRALDHTAERWVRSDSAYFVGALTGTYDQLLEPLPYYRGVNLQDPLVNPWRF